MKEKAQRCFLYDVYDEDGCLLVQKGSVVTESIENMLKKRNVTFQTTETKVEYFLEDIYDRNGQLLVPKGTMITQNLEDLLRRRHIQYRWGKQLTPSVERPPVSFKSFMEEDEEEFKPVVSVNRKNVTDIRTNISNVAIRMPQIDYDSLMHASEAVSDILNQGKNKMWGLHINSLANCVDWIYSHSINVSIISTLLAKKLDFPSKMAYHTGIAAILHDIGMVMVPDDVLNSPDKLLQEDEKLIQSHPRLGYKMLLNTDLPDEVLLAVLQHHEKMDGQGYPANLSGKEICVIARVIRIVDTFDSMTSDRPHRKAWSLQETLEEMKLKEFVGFDPIIFKEFLKLFYLRNW